MLVASSVSVMRTSDVFVFLRIERDRRAERTAYKALNGLAAPV
jgi:hypothetical protein